MFLQVSVILNLLGIIEFIYTVLRGIGKSYK